jgi:serine protease Do
MSKLQSKTPLLLSLVLIAGFISGMISLFVLGTAGAASKRMGTENKVPSLSPAGRELLDQFSVAFESAAAKVNQSVVPIYSEQVTEVQNPFASGNDAFKDFFGNDFFKRFFGPEKQKQVERTLGSGVIVSKDGYILTNNHVVDGSQKLTVVLADKEKYTAKVIGRDPNTDVAVIKINAKDLPVATLGNSDQVKIGEWVIAVGNPFQLTHTVTAGIISAKGRASVNLADYEDFIQTDASINPGNSGGALADLDRNVIGINTAIYSPSGGNVGIGFAIPINMAKTVMEELISKGKVTRGYLGLIPQDIDASLAKALNLKTTEGSIVGDVTAGGPAAKAGIKHGDVILEFNGKKIEGSTELRNIVAATAPGSSVAVQILRDGKEKDLTVTVGERPSDAELANGSKSEPEQESQTKLGLSIQTLTSAIAGQLNYKNDHGVVITEVTPGSPADDAGMQRGDLIKEVDQTVVRSVSDFQKAVGTLHTGDSVAFLVRRGENTFYVGIQIP